MGNILGIDIGGSGIKGTLVDLEKGTFAVERYRIDTPANAEPEHLLQLVKKIAEHYNYNGIIGCGFPGVIHHGIVLTAANLSKEWIGVNLEDEIYKTTSCKTAALNDADAAGIAEFRYGEGRNVHGLVLLLTIGTGIGSVLSYNGVLIPNTEFGHIQFNGDIAEKYASDAVKKQLDLKRKDWALRLNEYLCYMENLLYPDLIILGGGVSKKFEKYGHLFTTRVKVVPAKLLNNAGIIGAAIYANEKLN